MYGDMERGSEVALESLSKHDTMFRLKPRGEHATTRFHHTSRRCGIRANRSGRAG